MPELPRALPAKNDPVIIDRRVFLAGAISAPVLLAGGGLVLLTTRREPGSGTLRALVIDQDKCCGCRLCEIACNESCGDPKRALIRVHRFAGPTYVAWACLGCADVPCVRACDYYVDRFRGIRALHVDPQSGAIVLDREACSGCERCIEECSRHGAGVLRWDANEYITGVCDLCSGKPRCAKICPTLAIRMVDVTSGSMNAARTIEQVRAAGQARLYGGAPR
jgi:Fe-S-cluster-containing hydrogenase component 2